MGTASAIPSQTENKRRATRSRAITGSVTLADVAKAAGVAPMTVSRYLNNHPNVTDRTSRKVRAAIDKLGYSPNQAARMLMGQPSNVIGLVVPNLADPFFAEVAYNVQDIARQRGYLVWVASSNSNVETEHQVISQMKQHRVDGVLLIPASRNEEIYTATGNPPIVTIDRPIDGLSGVLVENRRSSEQAVDHLIGHGYTRIACLGADPEVFTMRERVTGYEDAMRRHNLQPLVNMNCTDLPTMARILADLMSEKSPIQAIFTLNSLTTIQALRTLSDMGISVPNEVALFGFDDFDLTGVMKPSVSVIRQPGAELGRSASRQLFERLSSKESPLPAITILSSTLVVRESCGCQRRALMPHLAA